MKIMILKELFDSGYTPEVKYKKKIKNKGTNSASLIHVASFETDLGNKVDIIIKPLVGDSYELSFFVNGEMGEKPRGEQDRQILTGVLNLLPKIAKKYNMEEIQIESWTDHKEFHITKNLTIGDVKKELIKKLKHYVILAKNEGLNFYNDFEKEIGIEMATNFLNALKETNVDILKNINILKLPPYGEISLDIMKLSEEFRKRVLSNTEEGYKTPKNRRHEIYKKLLPRFMPDWNIKEVNHGTTYKGFELTKKQ